ncbi:MAG: ORF6N domain-containing protein [Bacilli bacterium]|nr:ORF6N domain-containing protein [Bacilli bacterium]
MTNEIAIITEEDIRNKIYVIRGIKVMLDSDLAKIYGYSTKDFNRQVKNNIERFDDDFMFQLTNKEIDYLSRCKNFTAMQTKGIKGGRTSNPYVFTEDGIYMLMTVLKGEKAVLQSKTLIRIFRRLKDYVIDNNLIEQRYINNLVLKHDNKFIEYDSKFEEIFNKFDSDNYLKNKLIFEKHIYDAYSFLLDILNEAKEEIIIIDNYCDKEILDLISSLNVKVIVISKNMNDELIKKYQTQYNNLTIKYDNFFS